MGRSFQESSVFAKGMLVDCIIEFEITSDMAVCLQWAVSFSVFPGTLGYPYDHVLSSMSTDRDHQCESSTAQCGQGLVELRLLGRSVVEAKAVVLPAARR